MLDDYAFFAQALIELATSNEAYTYDVLNAMRERFEDPGRRRVLLQRRQAPTT